jgi:hypothetical protein
MTFARAASFMSRGADVILGCALVSSTTLTRDLYKSRTCADQSWLDDAVRQLYQICDGLVDDAALQSALKLEDYAEPTCR